MKPWDRQKNEPARAYKAFCEYLSLTPKRSLSILASKGWRLATVGKWSSLYSWQERVAACETEQLTKAMRGREALQEKIRQKLIDKMDQATDALFELLDGELKGFGKSTPILDRHGEEVGQEPLVKASTRLQIIKEILDRAGITVPKRIELTGADGKELLIKAQAEVAQLSDDQIVALMKVFDGGDGG